MICSGLSPRLVESNDLSVHEPASSFNLEHQGSCIFSTEGLQLRYSGPACLHLVSFHSRGFRCRENLIHRLMTSDPVTFEMTILKRALQTVFLSPRRPFLLQSPTSVKIGLPIPDCEKGQPCMHEPLQYIYRRRQGKIQDTRYRPFPFNNYQVNQQGKVQPLTLLASGCGEKEKTLKEAHRCAFSTLHTSAAI